MKGISIRAVADAGARVTAGGTGYGPSKGYQVKTVEDGKPVENPKIEPSTSGSIQDKDGTRISLSSSELGLGVQGSAAGGVAGIDVSINKDQLEKGINQIKNELKQDLQKLINPTQPRTWED